jgi:16S rRNA (cytosine967-C5)-methyltransferase
VKPSCLKLAAEIVAAAGQSQRADAVLREALKQQRGVTVSEAREIADFVLGWFRWRGWLDFSETQEKQFADVAELDERFRGDPESFSEDELSRAVPDWIWDEMEVSKAWLRSLQAKPRLWLRAKRGRGRALAEKLGDCWIPDGYPEAVEYRGTEDLFRTAEFQAGEFEIQDIASQSVGLLCDPKPGEAWWDACAGEGGKTLHLSDLMQNKGLIWASDRAEWRLKKLKLRAARAQSFNYRAVVWSSLDRLPTKTKFDGVLVDAPCSGVGTWQRNPHARWSTTAEDVRQLSEIQANLLERAALAVKPGGRLLYAVCTFTREETTSIVEAFGRVRNDFCPIELKLPAVTKAGPSLTLWPQETGGNGMFVAAWRRNKP